MCELEGNGDAVARKAINRKLGLKREREIFG